jgi:hypothetical protein
VDDAPLHEPGHRPVQQLPLGVLPLLAVDFHLQAAASRGSVVRRLQAGEMYASFQMIPFVRTTSMERTEKVQASVWV